MQFQDQEVAVSRRSLETLRRLEIRRQKYTGRVEQDGLAARKLASSCCRADRSSIL
jgi:hypothetical protein